MPSLIKGKQIADDTIAKSKLKLISPTAAKDPVTKGYFDARTINGKPLSSNVILTKTDFSLQNVDNTSDLNKPISNLQKVALDLKLPFGTIAELKSNTDTNLKAFQVIDKNKDGIFMYDPSDNTTIGDDIMVVVNGGKRFKRVYKEIYPEWWGAKADNISDSAPAFQAMFNWIPVQGATVQLDFGVYLLNAQITLKPVTLAPLYEYKLNIKGRGVGKTIIGGMMNFTGNMFYINTGEFSGGAKNCWIKIEDIQFIAQTAARILYGTEITTLKLINNIFAGGETAGIEIGEEGSGGGYSVYMQNNYHNGTSYTGAGSIPVLMKLWNCRFFIIDGFESDGGGYGIQLLGTSDKNIITNSKIEGSKIAGVSINNMGAGGGENQILNSTINPYIGHDNNTRFTGEVNCVEIIQIGNGGSHNTVSNCLLLAQSQQFLPIVTTTTANTGTFITGPDLNSYGLDGLTSGALGYVNGFDPITKKLVIQKVTGTFLPGEVVKQRTTNAQGTLGTFVETSCSGVKLAGEGGSNIIIGNKVRNYPKYGIYNRSRYNIIANNNLEAENAIYNETGATTIVNSNILYSPNGKAIHNVAGSVVYTANHVMLGDVVGVEDYYMRSGQPTTSVSVTNNVTEPMISSTDARSGSTTQSFFVNSVNSTKIGHNRNPYGGAYKDPTKHSVAWEMLGDETQGYIEANVTTSPGAVPVTMFRIQNPVTGNDTSLVLMQNGQLRRVTIGEPNSGGAGKRTLTIDN